jgi:hypothetical protein
LWMTGAACGVGGWGHTILSGARMGESARLRIPKWIVVTETA